MAREMMEVLNPRDAAQFLGIHEETLRRLARERKIPGYKVGGVWRFNRSSLMKWAESQQVTPASPKILLVDDEESIRETLSRLMEAVRFTVTTAATGAEAIKHLRAERPDLVLLDLKLPDMSGAAVLKEIRTLHEGVPVIIITGYPESSLVTEALEFTPVMLLAKPVSPPKLLESMRQTIGVGKRAK